MPELIPFDYEGTSVRILIKDGEPWLIATHTIRVTPKGLDLLAAHFDVTITMEGNDNDAP